MELQTLAHQLWTALLPRGARYFLLHLRCAKSHYEHWSSTNLGTCNDLGSHFPQASQKQKQYHTVTLSCISGAHTGTSCPQ